VNGSRQLGDQILIAPRHCEHSRGTGLPRNCDFVASRKIQERDDACALIRKKGAAICKLIGFRVI
jgi:hypothetical protein